jgi:hypothetical protein
MSLEEAMEKAFILTAERIEDIMRLIKFSYKI